MSLSPQSGFVPRQAAIGGRTYHFVDWLPPGYRADRPWPLLLYLHSSGERGEDGEGHSHAGLGLALRRYPERFPCVVTLPRCPEGCWWVDAPLHADGGEPVTALVDLALGSALDRYSVNPGSVALTGISMGGYGAWIYGARHARRFARLLPVCGGWREEEDHRPLLELPIWAHHGELDDAVPVEESRRMNDLLTQAGGQVRYTEYPGVGHECWDIVYGDPAVAAWLCGGKRATPQGVSAKQ